MGADINRLYGCNELGSVLSVFTASMAGSLPLSENHMSNLLCTYQINRIKLRLGFQKETLFYPAHLSSFRRLQEVFPFRVYWAKFEKTCH